MSPFAIQSGPFARFLQSISGLTGDEAADTAAIVARNFLLDEGVTIARFNSYQVAGGVREHADYGEWKLAHEKYLKRQVRLIVDQRPSLSLNPDDEQECPETFRFIEANSPFQYSDGNLELLRVVELPFVADTAGVPPAEVKLLAQTVVASSDPHLPERQAFDDILDAWSLHIDHRPVYSGYWEDLDDLFGNTPTEDGPDWANRLRDRLGLVHLAPGLRGAHGLPLDILVFRYPILSIPRLRNSTAEQRPLVPPTVLDSAHSAAFCPAPAGQSTGHAVDLSLEKPICREVLHPVMEFCAEQLWRVGQVTKNVDMQQLIEARRWHLLVLRDLPGCAEFADATDADLIR